MTEFKQLADLVKAISEMEGIDPDHKRYLDGFRFGLDAASEIGGFEPWPEQIALIGLEDPLIVGMFDGRAGNPHNVIRLAGPGGWATLRAELRAAMRKS